LAVQRLISSSIVMLMSVISTHYDLSRISVGHYSCPQEWLRAVVRSCIEKTDYPFPEELVLSTPSR
ncbi:hypothetical protein ACSZND_23560, partial [Aeromonas hydrophila]